MKNNIKNFPQHMTARWQKLFSFQIGCSDGIHEADSGKVMRIGAGLMLSNNKK